MVKKKGNSNNYSSPLHCIPLYTALRKKYCTTTAFKLFTHITSNVHFKMTATITGDKKRTISCFVEHCRGPDKRQKRKIHALRPDNTRLSSWSHTSESGQSHSRDLSPLVLSQSKKIYPDQISREGKKPRKLFFKKTTCTATWIFKEAVSRSQKVESVSVFLSRLRTRLKGPPLIALSIVSVALSAAAPCNR